MIWIVEFLRTIDTIKEISMQLKFCPSMYLVSTIELYQWDLLISIFYDKKFYCSNFIAESFFYYVLLFIIELLKYMYILICNQKKKKLVRKVLCIYLDLS